MPEDKTNELTELTVGVGKAVAILAVVGLGFALAVAIVNAVVGLL